MFVRTGRWGMIASHFIAAGPLSGIDDTKVARPSDYSLLSLYLRSLYTFAVGQI